jgi:hypothetical protein
LASQNEFCFVGLFGNDAHFNEYSTVNYNVSALRSPALSQDQQRAVAAVAAAM